METTPNLTMYAEMITLLVLALGTIGLFSYLIYLGTKKEKTWARILATLLFVSVSLLGLGYLYLGALGSNMGL